MQDAIAQHFGISVVNTLTGFKYISAKLQKYEDKLPAAIRDEVSRPVRRRKRARRD